MDKYIDFELPDGYGNMVSVSETLKNNNVWVFFYRGNW